jgi:hypothetical protein
MPFLTAEKKRQMEKTKLSELNPKDALELSHVLHIVAKRYLGPNVTHTKVNEVMGAFENVKQEIFRDKIAPFNRQAQHDNDNDY